jgi:hypothetical protein
MVRRLISLVAIALVATASTALAQATGMPSFNAPHRAFDRHEFGGTLSFPEGDLTGIEGQYRFGYQTFDIGLRGGILDTPGDTEVLLGAEGRVRVLSHNESLPLDGAVIVGAGTIGFDNLLIPGGLSLGRRIDIEDSPVSIIPYAQPTLWLNFDDVDGNDTVLFGLGFGADFRLSDRFDVRASVGLGDVEGFSVSAVWVR